MQIQFLRTLRTQFKRDHNKHSAAAHYPVRQQQIAIKQREKITLNPKLELLVIAGDREGYWTLLNSGRSWIAMSWIEFHYVSLRRRRRWWRRRQRFCLFTPIEYRMWCERHGLNELCALLGWLLYHRRDSYHHIINFIILLFYLLLLSFIGRYDSSFRVVRISYSLSFVGFARAITYVLCARARVWFQNFKIHTLSRTKFISMLFRFFPLSLSFSFILSIRMRSARSDCVPEANRNYYAHISTYDSTGFYVYEKIYRWMRWCWTAWKAFRMLADLIESTNCLSIWF